LRACRQGPCLSAWLKNAFEFVPELLQHKQLT
jgi:hypothetical protein